MVNSIIFTLEDFLILFFPNNPNRGELDQKKIKFGFW